MASSVQPPIYLGNPAAGVFGGVGEQDIGGREVAVDYIVAV